MNSGRSSAFRLYIVASGYGRRAYHSCSLFQKIIRSQNKPSAPQRVPSARTTVGSRTAGEMTRNSTAGYQNRPLSTISKTAAIAAPGSPHGIKLQAYNRMNSTRVPTGEAKPARTQPLTTSQKFNVSQSSNVRPGAQGSVSPKGVTWNEKVHTKTAEGFEQHDHLLTDARISTRTENSSEG